AIHVPHDAQDARVLAEPACHRQALRVVCFVISHPCFDPPTQEVATGVLLCEGEFDGLLHLHPERRRSPGQWRANGDADRLPLDLANTVSWRRSADPIERLRDYGDVLEWARQARVITPREARTLARAAARHPRQATAVLGRVRILREAIYRVFAALARGQSPSPADFALLDAEFRGALRHL